ncbi:hypothetical protein R1S87_000711 [Escherichia coli]|nr:hypothetical protein [Escherichia coli]
MAKSRYDVEINGDNKGLSKSIDKSMEQLNELDSVANGLFSNMTGPLNNLNSGISGIAGMSSGMQALGIAGMAACVGVAALNTALEKTRELNQISTSTGLSVEYLQQLQKEFRTTGMEIDRFGDLNKDTLDHLGDSFREGAGGIGDDLEKWGIGLERYTQYVNDAEGGIKALVQTYYDLKKAGASQAEIVNGMESMASDGSHLITVLEKYGSTQEALNAINNQSASITNETAREYQGFDENMKTLSVNLDNLTVNVMDPLVSKMNNLYDIANKDWTASNILDFFTMIDRLRPDKMLADWAADTVVDAYADANPTSGAGQRKQQKDYLDTTERFLKQTKAQGDKAYEKRKQDEITRAKLQKQRNEKASEDAKKEADKAKREADRIAREQERSGKEKLGLQEQAARESKAAYDKMMQERETALQSLSSLDAAILSQEGRTISNQVSQVQQAIKTISELEKKGIISAEQAKQRRNMLFKTSNAEFRQTLMTSPEEIGAITTSLEVVYQQQLEQLEAKKAQSLISQQEYNTQVEALQQDHQSRLEAIKATSGDGNMANMKNLSALGFATDEEQMAIQQAALDEQFQKMREQNQKLYDGQLINHEQFLQQKARLDQAYAAKSKQITFLETQTKLQMYNGLASGMGSIIAGIAGESSDAAQAVFAIQKGTAIASGMLNAYESATAAMAKYPGPMGYAIAASSYARVIGQVLQMKSVNITGMAHDGISEVPREGTWLLDGGERVVDERTNSDLKEFLDNNKIGEATKIDASIHVNGNVTDQRWFAEQLKRQQQNIAAIVQDCNRRKM